MNQQDLILDEVYDIWPTSFWQTPVGYGILFLLVLAFLAGLYTVMRYMQWRRGTVPERSLRSLRALAHKTNSGEREPKRVYQELTSTIKSYSHWRYGLPRGMTDYELTTLLSAAKCDKMHHSEVQRILTDAQIVKFGHVEILKSQMQRDIAAIITFIEASAKSKE